VDLPKIEKSVMPWIGKTGKLMGAYAMDKFKQYKINLTVEQWVTLKILHEEDGRIQNDLAIVTNRDKTSLTRLINNMEKNGLVVRKSHKEDKRINLVYLTSQGKKMFKKTMPIMDEVIEGIQYGLDKAEIKILIKILKKVQNNLNR